MDVGDFDDHGAQFTTGLVNVLSNPSVASVGKVLLGAIAAWHPLGKAAAKIDGPEDRRWLYMIVPVIPFCLWIAFIALELMVITRWMDCTVWIIRVCMRALSLTPYDRSTASIATWLKITLQ